MKKKLPPPKPAGGVTIQDWLRSKPYAISTNYDRPYLNLCEEVFKILHKRKEWFEEGKVDRQSRKELACIIVSYFEDFINEIGIWKAFTDYNLELHGYRLPFYPLPEYDADYLNEEDIAYLIWHYMTKCLDTRIYAPDHVYIMGLAEVIYDLLEAEIDDAPATPYYEDFLSIPDGSDFFDLKTKLAWMGTQSYLMGLELGKDLKTAIEKFMQSKESRQHPDMVPQFIYTLQEDYLYVKRSSFAAMNAPEWLSKIARCSDAKRLEISALQFRRQGTYLYEKEEQKHYLFRHLTTEQQYRVLKNSVKKGAGMGKAGKISFRMTLVEWEGEWMLTGTMAGWQLDREEMEKQKHQQAATPWIYSEEKLGRMREITDLMYKAFVDFFGSPLALFGNNKELQQGMNDYIQFYHSRLGNLDADYERRRDAYRAKHFGGQGMELSDLSEGHGFGLMFVEGVGITTLQDIQDTLIWLKKENLGSEDKKDLFFELLVNYEPDVAEFLLQHFGHKNFEHPVQVSEVDAWRDRNFYWRFYSPESFGPRFPMMTAVDMGKG